MRNTHLIAPFNMCPTNNKVGKNYLRPQFGALLDKSDRIQKYILKDVDF